MKIPRELKDLASFVANNGFTLAIPFNDIRRVGYIGRFDEKGREHIVDDATCLEKVKSKKARRPSKVVLGEFSKQTKFSAKVFLKAFQSILGIETGLESAKSVTLKFPKRFLQSNFLTELEIEEALPVLSPACRKRVADPRNFVITQTLETDAIQYEVELRRKAEGKAQVDLKNSILEKARGLELNAEVKWEGDKKYSIVVSDPEVRLTVAYKAMRVSAVSFKP